MVCIEDLDVGDIVKIDYNIGDDFIKRCCPKTYAKYNGNMGAVVQIHNNTNVEIKIPVMLYTKWVSTEHIIKIYTTIFNDFAYYCINSAITSIRRPMTELKIL